jgi:sigma54-dependent transcription regulator
LYLSVRHAGTISSEFNNTERDMDKLEFQTSKEATWRNHLARHAASGKSIAAFCRDEAISQANFHVWRTKLANGANEHAARPAPQATFIDLGAVNSAVGSRATERAPAPAPLAIPSIDIRIDLGGGVVLTIARR